MTLEEKIEDAIQRVFDREEAFAIAKRLEKESEFNHKIKRASEYLKSEGTVKEREMEADIACRSEMEIRFRTEADSDITYQYLQDARAVLSALQTLLKSKDVRI